MHGTTTGKRVVVTDANGGIVQAAVRRFASKGRGILICALGAAALQADRYEEGPLTPCWLPTVSLDDEPAPWLLEIAKRLFVSRTGCSQKNAPE